MLTQVLKGAQLLVPIMHIGSGASVYSAYTVLGMPEGVESGIPPVLEVLMQAIMHMFQSQCALQQAFSEGQKMVGQMVEIQARM